MQPTLNRQALTESIHTMVDIDKGIRYFIVLDLTVPWPQRSAGQLQQPYNQNPSLYQGNRGLFIMLMKCNKISNKCCSTVPTVLQCIAYCTVSQ